MLLEEHPSSPTHKANLHSKLQSQVADARIKSKNKHLMLDSYIISATPYDDLQKKHGLEWDRSKYAAAHILFFSNDGTKSYLEKILA
jgi:hypothetical protein